MKNSFLCNICKEKLENFNDKLVCKNCKNKIKYSENFIDFSKRKNFDFDDFPKKKLSKLISKIDENGYYSAVDEFLKENQVLSKYISDNKSADFIFHAINKKNIRCLEIGSGFGKNIEILSKIFQEVYSIEWNEQKIYFQKQRLKENGIINTKIIRVNPLDLPFSDNYFDLVICNSGFELISENKKPSFEAQKKFLVELKRVIKDEGCFSLGVENGSSFGSLTGKDISFKKHEKDKIKHTFQDYQKIFLDLGLEFDAYWVLPSLMKPYFSGKVDDKTTTKWFYENYQRFILKEKQDRIKNIVFSSFGKMNNLTSNTMTKKFVPNFIFCCYKNAKFVPYEKIILKNSNFSNFLLMGRKSRLIYVLFNKKSIPEKMISLDRFGLDFPEKIENFERKMPNMKDPSKRVWIEDWISGAEIDPTNIEHLSKAILWLINFQKKSKTEELSKTEKSREVLWFKKRIVNFPEINKENYLKWLKDYEEFLYNNKIEKVARHGDFWYTNILLDKKTNQTNVIDWENFSREGNPFYDFLTFILHVMTLPSKDPVIVFRESLEFKGVFGKIMKKIKNEISEHFGFKFNLVILLRFFIIRNIIRSNIKGKKLNNHIKMLEMLSEEKYLRKLRE